MTWTVCVQPFDMARLGLLARTDADFTLAMGLLLRDVDLRQRYANNAVRWAAQFDWDHTAQQTLAILGESSGLLVHTSVEDARPVSVLSGARELVHA